MSATYGWVKQGHDMNKTRSKATWYDKGSDPVVDMGIYSDEEGGVTGLWC